MSVRILCPSAWNVSREGQIASQNEDIITPISVQGFLGIPGNRCGDHTQVHRSLDFSVLVIPHLFSLCLAPSRIYLSFGLSTIFSAGDCCWPPTRFSLHTHLGHLVHSQPFTNNHVWVSRIPFPSQFSLGSRLLCSVLGCLHTPQITSAAPDCMSSHLHLLLFLHSLTWLVAPVWTSHPG